MRMRLGASHLRSPFFLFMSHCRWTCVSHADSDASSDHQGTSDFLGLVEHAQCSGQWEEMDTDATGLGEMSTETAFITEDMLQSISTGINNLNSLRALSNSARSLRNGGTVTHSPLDSRNANCCGAHGCCHDYGSDMSLRDVIMTRQHCSGCISRHNINDNENETMETCVNDNTITHRSSVDNNDCNDLISELLTFHPLQQQQQDIPNENDLRRMRDPDDGDRASSAQVHETCSDRNDHPTTIEVEGVTSTSSSDCCVQNSPGNRDSDASLPSDLSAAALVEDDVPVEDQSGASGDATVHPEELEQHAGELSDILFRFDRQFRLNTGFGFANWRWSHRHSNQVGGNGGGAAADSANDNSLQRQARWLKRLQMHQSTATPTHSNSNSLRSTRSSASSDSVRGAQGNLQQEWYFYDPRLVPQNRTQRLAIQTNHNHVQTTSYVSNIVNPPTYEELVSVMGPEVLAQAEAGTMMATGMSEAPPSFEDAAHIPSSVLFSTNSEPIPSEPPPPYVDSGLAPVYDLDPNALMDPPPQYDDHSFSEDDGLAPIDPMDPSGPSAGQGEDDNFILTQSTTVQSEMDGNFILSAPPRINRRPAEVSQTPDTQSVASDPSDVREEESSSDANSCYDLDASRFDAAAEEIVGQERAAMPRPLQELFRDPHISPEEDSPNPVDPERETNRSPPAGNTGNPLGSNQHPHRSRIFPGYQLLHSGPSVLPWSNLGHSTQEPDNANEDSLDNDVTEDLVDDLPTEQHQDNSRSLANFSNDAYPAGFVSGNGGPPLRWSRGVGFGRWNSHNWAI